LLVLSANLSIFARGDFLPAFSICSRFRSSFESVLSFCELFDQLDYVLAQSLGYDRTRYFLILNRVVQQRRNDELRVLSLVASTTSVATSSKWFM
jgi:hypothetical protein